MFTLPDLDYSYNSLEPHFDSSTMEIHHSKHHATYVKNLNDVLSNYTPLKDADNSDLERIIKNLDNLPEEIRTKVQNQGGGHLNHTFFWKCLTPKPVQVPENVLTLLNSNFGSFDAFKDQFTKVSLAHFGSGWTWLVKADNKLEISTTPNQNSPITLGKNPLLGLDLWEHAYYLKYQNRRSEYVSSWWNLVNWTNVSQLLTL